MVLLAVRRPDLLARSLRSLEATAGDGVPFEVIVVLNAATPEVVEYMDSYVHGARIIRSPVNLGVAGGFNRAFAAARAARIALVHDDSVARPGWLVALRRTAEANPDAGAVGGRVYGRDGELRDVGWIIWRDGTTSVPWVGAPPTAGAFAQVRAVDYHGSVGLLVDRAAWESVGGFDDGIYPAYYVDVDFSLRLRNAGWRVLYEPSAVLDHHVGASSERAVALLMSRRNRRQLLARHALALADHGKPEPREPFAVGREIRRAAAAEASPRPRRSRSGAEGLLAERLARPDEHYLAAERDLWRNLADDLQGDLDDERSARWTEAHLRLAEQKLAEARATALLGERELAQEQARILRSQVSDARADAVALQALLDEANARAAALHQQLHLALTSRWWRLGERLRRLDPR